MLTAVVGTAAKTAAPVVGGYVSITEYQAELEELREEITMREAIEPAKFLKMELSITNSTMSILNARDSKVNEKKQNDDLQVALHPTHETYAILERWKEVHEYNANIPYPKEIIQAQDWNEIGDDIKELAYNSELYNYIFNNTSIYKDDLKVKPEELANEYSK